MGCRTYNSSRTGVYGVDGGGELHALAAVESVYKRKVKGKNELVRSGCEALPLQLSVSVSHTAVAIRDPACDGADKHRASCTLSMSRLALRWLTFTL